MVQTRTLDLSRVRRYFQKILADRQMNRLKPFEKTFELATKSLKNFCDKPTDRPTNGWTDRQTEGWTDRWTKKRLMRGV